MSISPGTVSGNPTKLHSYLYTFHEIIERAKQLVQCGGATDPFLSQAQFIDDKSSVYITEAIAEHEEKGVLIPPGECHNTSMNDTS